MAAHKPMSVKTDLMNYPAFTFDALAPFFGQEPRTVVLLVANFVQRTVDLFPDLGCVLQMFSDVCHRRMTAVPW